MCPFRISDLLDATSSLKLSDAERRTCQTLSSIFRKLTHDCSENIFSAIASDSRVCFSRLMKLEIPGENACALVEKIREALYAGADDDTIAKLYLQSLNAVFQYLAMSRKDVLVGEDDAVRGALLFYEAYGHRCFHLPEESYREIKAGNNHASYAFFSEYLAQYHKHMKDILELPGFGAARNYSMMYRQTMYKFIELLICQARLYAFMLEVGEKSLALFLERLQKEDVLEQEAFYQLWLSVNDEIIAEEYAKEEFSDRLLETSTLFNELLVHTKHLFEKNIEFFPIARESDMRELYKTIYDLKKEVALLKKELAEVKA